MREDVKRRWIEALTSGEYAQAEGALRNPAGFCCLGVLCDIASKDAAIGEWSTEPNSINNFTFHTAADEASGALPDEVEEWAETLESDPYLFSDPDGNDVTLAVLNDSGVDFPTIAKLIEYHL